MEMLSPYSTQSPEMRSSSVLRPFLLLEDEVGGPQPLPRWRLLQWLRQREGVSATKASTKAPRSKIDSTEFQPNEFYN